MNSLKFNVARRRYYLTDRNVIVFQGWFDKKCADKCKLEAVLDDKKIEGRIEKNAGMEVRQRYVPYGNDICEEHYFYVRLPQQLRSYHTLKLQVIDGQKEVQQICSVPVKTILSEQAKVDYCIDAIEVHKDATIIRGWIASEDKISVTITYDGSNIPGTEISYHSRQDVKSTYLEGNLVENCGFEIRLPKNMSQKVMLQLSDGSRTTDYNINLAAVKRVDKMSSNKYLGKAYSYFTRYGLRQFVVRLGEKVRNSPDNKVDRYDEIRIRNQLKKEEIELQRKEKFDKMPKFSIVVPLYKTPKKYLQALIDSVRNQTYSNWELCLSEGSGEQIAIHKYLKNLEKTDHRIHVFYSDKPLQISENTNAAIELATGDFIVFSDHDDTLAIDALYECAKVCHEQQNAELIYTDEDKISMNGKRFFQPHFKPDFNIDLLCSMNYFCHLVVVKKTLADKVGRLNPEFDGAQDYDFILRCVEATEYIYHIPRVLYHWRAHANSTAENPESKRYAFQAGQRAIEAHYKRCKIPATVIEGEYPGLYRTTYHWEEQPLLSIVIPNKDHTEDLEKCIHSIESKSSYKNYEYIIVENNSEEEKTFQYYEKLQKENSKVKVVYWKEEFNYSKINNYGVSYAEGEYILLLNNDTEIINADCFCEMLGYCQRDDVGIVGARLYYEDDMIQHAGVVIGFGGIAGHAFIGSRRDENGYFSRIICAQDYSAVTAACLMTKKAVFKEVHGLTEELCVAFNDIDYCLKVRETGKLVVYNPYAELYHYESKSRGLEDSPEKQARFYREMDFFTKKWAEMIEDGDPYYNPNLALDKADFSLKNA